MKTSKQCPKCQSLAIGYLPQQIDRGHYSQPGPRGVGTVATIGLFFDGVEVKGELEAYVCTACGYYETYVRDPAVVPWTSLNGFQWVNPKAEPDGGPYR